MGDLRPTLAMPEVIYATHAVELASMGLRKLTKNGRLFLGDEAPTKLNLHGPTQDQLEVGHAHT